MLEFFFNCLIGFFFFRFDLCTSDGNISIVENFGQALFGEKIELSGYNVSTQICLQ